MEYLSQGRNVIVLRTFSKIYGLAGLRIGYGITTPEIAGLVNRVREPFNVNLLAQTAAIGALSDKEHLEKSREVNIQGREFLYREFSRMGLEYVPTEANFIFVDIKGLPAGVPGAAQGRCHRTHRRHFRVSNLSQGDYR